MAQVFVCVFFSFFCPNKPGFLLSQKEICLMDSAIVSQKRHFKVVDSVESKTSLGSNKAKCFLPEMKPLELQTNFDPTL